MKGMGEELGGQQEEGRDTKRFKERNKEGEGRVYKGIFFKHIMLVHQKVTARPHDVLR